MIQVHLIGYTADLRYLVLDVDADSERGRYRLPVDVDLFLTLDEVRELRRGEGMEAGPALIPTDAVASPEASPAPAPLAEDTAEEELFAERGAETAPSPTEDVPPAPAGEVAPAPVDEAPSAPADEIAPAPVAPSPFAGHVGGTVKVVPAPPNDPDAQRQPPETEDAPPLAQPPATAEEAADGDGEELSEEPAPEEELASQEEPASDEEPQEERDQQPAPGGDERADGPSRRPRARPAGVPSGAPESDGRRTPRVGQAERSQSDPRRTATDRRPAATADSGSALSPAQIQSLLRSGRSPKSVARAAGTDVAWVERWLPPILAERDQVLREARNQRLERSRLGRSRKPLGAAITASLAARNIDANDVTWTASRRVDGRWSINIRFRHRGRSRSATWAFDREEGTLTAASPLARDLGWTGSNSRGRGGTRGGGSRRKSGGRQRRPSRS